MSSAEFILFSFEHWLSIVLWSFLFVSALFFIYRKLVPGGSYDPFHLFVAINLGTAYAVVFSLYQFGEISNRIFVMILSYAFVLFVSLYVFLKYKVSIKQLNSFFRAILTPKSSGYVEMIVIIGVYFVLSVFLINSSGLAAFTDTNRFEQAKGVGAFVRVLDLFRLIIIAYFTISIFDKRKNSEVSNTKHYSKLALLFFFVVFSSLQNGAKFALFESLFTMLIALKAKNIPVKINFYKVALVFAISTVFALVVLSIGLKRDVDADKGLYTETSNPLLDRFIFRILSNGDMYYLSLPNDVIDKIDKDNVAVRIGAQVFGNTPMSKLLGYNVSNYSVGKSILLYHDPNFELAGGPVSHIDLFSYIYLGYFGYLFTILVAYMIFSVAHSISNANNSTFYAAILSAMWLRCLAVLIEPPVGIAYVIDILVIMMLINLFGFFVRKFLNII